MILVYMCLHLIRIECTLHLPYVFFLPFNLISKSFLCFHFSAGNMHTPSKNVFVSFKPGSAARRRTKGLGEGSGIWRDRWKMWNKCSLLRRDKRPWGIPEKAVEEIHLFIQHLFIELPQFRHCCIPRGSSSENSPALVEFMLGLKLGRECFPSPSLRHVALVGHWYQLRAASVDIFGCGQFEISSCWIWMFCVKDTFWMILLIFIFIFHIHARLPSGLLLQSSHP